MDNPATRAILMYTPVRLEFWAADGQAHVYVVVGRVGGSPSVCVRSTSVARQVGDGAASDRSPGER
eukprot:14190-Chlamydomonas_euryale.AAC.1